MGRDGEARLSVPMNRRDFLLLRPGSARHAAVLSCEQLYMRYVDAQALCATDRLFQGLARDLGRVRTVRLTDTSWLSCEPLKRELEQVLAQFRAAGGRVLT